MLFGASILEYERVTDIPVTIVVDQTIAQQNPNWQDDLRKVVEFDDRLVTRHKVRFVVKDYQIVDFPQDENMTNKERETRFLSNINRKFPASTVGEVVIVFTKNMPEGFCHDYGLSCWDNRVFIHEDYPDWLDFTKPIPRPRTSLQGPDAETYTYQVQKDMEILAPYVK